MNIESQISGPLEPAGPVLTATQQVVLEALRHRETESYPLSQWYLGALHALANPYNPDHLSQAAQSLRELVEKLPRVVQDSDTPIRNPDFNEERRQLHSRFTRDRERYQEGWRGREIDSQLDRTLNRASHYFELSQRPTRREQIQRAIENIDPLSGLMDSQIRRRRSGVIQNLWSRLESFAHHRTNAEEDDFLDCLEVLEQAILDLLAPITADDQREIQSILALPARTETDGLRMIEIIERTGANYAFFFSRVVDPTWIPMLENRGYFSHPPEMEPLEEGGVVAPFWPPIQYLSRVASEAPEEVVRIALQIPKVNNPRVHDCLLYIALNTPGPVSARLKPKVIEYARAGLHTMPYSFRDLLVHWTEENEVPAALELTSVLTRFWPDPQADAKEQHRRNNPDDWTTMTALIPSPAFGEWDYAEILDEGVRPLAKIEPYGVASALVAATIRLLNLKTHRDDRESGNYNDRSEIWCQRLTRSGNDRYRQSDTVLVQALTYACERVFDSSPERVSQLDETLRKQPWRLFGRLRRHLYGLYPDEKTLPWIRELILCHEDYSNWAYHYEFQLMIRRACEHFGEDLLTQDERKSIFSKVISGPSHAEYSMKIGNESTDERYEEYRRTFHLMQLGPFESVLFGEYRDYFRELEGVDAVSNEDYFPYRESEAEWVGSRSPKSVVELASLIDADLLHYINNWDDVRYESGDGLTRIDIQALATLSRTFS